LRASYGQTRLNGPKMHCNMTEKEKEQAWGQKGEDVLKVN